jgi:hypothetical protein
MVVAKRALQEDYWHWLKLFNLNVQMDVIYHVIIFTNFLLPVKVGQRG